MTVAAIGRTLVTGASGFVGAHLIDALRANGVTDLVAWGRTRQGDASVAQWHRVDILDRDTVRRAVADAAPSHLFHLAGAPHVGHSWKNVLPTLQLNVLGTHHLLEAVRLEAPRCRVLVVTSGMIYKPGPEPLREDAALVPTNPYGLSKLAEDQLARLASENDGLDVVVARPFNHIGPGQDPSFAASSFARQIARIEADLDEPILQVGNLDAERDLTDVRDVVRAYLAIMASGTRGKAYNVCTGHATSIRNVLHYLLTLTSARIEVAPDPDRLRPSDTPRLVGNPSRIRDEFGWQPRFPLEQTLADTLAWWRSAPLTDTTPHV